MKTLAIIPAKERSDRLPGKNMKPLLRKPLYEYSVEAAIGSALFGDIVVSTDIKEIMLHGWHTKGVTVMPRPEHLGHGAVVVDVCLNVLKESSVVYDVFCLLLPTAPLRSIEDISRSYAWFRDSKYDVVIGGTKFFQPWWQAFECRGLVWHPVNRYLCEKNEDEVPKRLTDNGAIYWARVDSFLRNKSFFPKDLGIYEMPFERSIDINTEVDFKMAEFFMVDLRLGEFFKKEEMRKGDNDEEVCR